MAATHVWRRTRWPVHLDHVRGKGLPFRVSLCMGGARGYTVSVHDVLTSTTSVLPALCDYSLRLRHTQHPGPNAHCPTTQPWFAFRTAVSLHVPSHLGSSCSVNSLSLRDAGTGATRSCTFDDHTFPSCLVAYPLAKMEYRSVNTSVLPDPWLTQEGPVTFPACALYQLFVRSCDLPHPGLYCSHVCAYTHHSSLQHLSLVFAFVLFQFSDGKTTECAAASWHH